MQTKISGLTEWLKWLYREFMKYPKWVRIGLGVFVVLVVLVLIPGEARLTAVIAFTATFSGIFVSFQEERRRRGTEEREQFTQILRSVSVESEDNQATLDYIRSAVSREGALPDELNTTALQAALSHPLFHQNADPSLIYASSFVRRQQAGINNLLFGYRIAAATMRGMTDADVRAIQLSAEVALDCIPVMQGVLGETLTKLGATIEKDSRYEQIRGRFGGIVREHRRRQAEASTNERSQG